MTFNHEKVDEILDALFPLPDRFGVDIDNDSTPLDIDMIEEAVHGADPDADIRSGVSKLVIISDNIGDVVIKIPFNGYLEEPIDDTDEEDDWHYFEGASSTDCTDYCLAEYEKFQELQNEHLNCFVAKTEFYVERCGVRVFVQEKVTPENDSWRTPQASKASETIANEWYDEGRFYINPDWIANCIDQYGTVQVQRFLDYCKYVDPDILGDVHSGNYGYREDGSPVILDYSNYNG